MAVTDTSAAKTCEVCGKDFIVLYQDLWRYKRGAKWLCSWKCLRAYDKKGEEKKVGSKRIISKEQEKEAIRLALEGGNPLRYLEECGSNNPPQKWYEIKLKIKERDPETYEKLPKKLPRKDSVKAEEPESTLADAMHGMQDASDKFFGACKDMGLKVEMPEATTWLPEPEPARTDFQIAALRHPVLGEFYYDRKFKSLDWRTNGGDEVSLSPACWKLLVELLPEILKTLGVEQ